MKTEKKEWCYRNAGKVLLLVPVLAAMLAFTAVGIFAFVIGEDMETILTLAGSAAGVVCVISFLLMAVWEVKSL